MIPWAKPTFWGNEKDYILQALNSTWLSGGPFVEKFEILIAGKFGYSFALSTTNGTSAIQATLSALNLKHGDEIIVPGYGFQAAANVALQLGIKPIFVDVDPDTWCIDVNSVRNSISKKNVDEPGETMDNKTRKKREELSVSACKTIKKEIVKIVVKFN